MFRIYSRINNFYVYVFYHYPMHDHSLYNCLLDSMAQVQSVDDMAVFVLVSDANAHHSECLDSVSPTDRHGPEALDFCNLSGCEQLVRCPTHIAGYRLDLVMTNIYSRCVRGYSTGHFRPVLCVLRVELSVYCLIINEKMSGDPCAPQPPANP